VPAFSSLLYEWAFMILIDEFVPGFSILLKTAAKINLGSILNLTGRSLPACTCRVWMLFSQDITNYLDSLKFWAYTILISGEEVSLI
jgi:hypothetical protein